MYEDGGYSGKTSLRAWNRPTVERLLSSMGEDVAMLLFLGRKEVIIQFHAEASRHVPPKSKGLPGETLPHSYATKFRLEKSPPLHMLPSPFFYIELSREVIGYSLTHFRLPHLLSLLFLLLCFCVWDH